MKSNRYRFWRMVAYIVVGALAGFSMGYMGAHFDSVGHLQLVIDWSVIQLLLSIFGVLSFAGEVYYLVQTRKTSQLLATLSEDEEIEQADKAANRAYNIASILGSLLSVVMFINMGLLAMTVGTDNGSLVMAGQTALVVVLALYSARLIRIGFKYVHGTEIPKNLSVKEMHQFLIGLMDEAEKQIQYEENYSLMLKLSGYVLPSVYFILFALRVFFDVDIILTVIIVSALYVYILISQYRIVKRYYK